MLENDDNLKWTKPKFVEICFFLFPYALEWNSPKKLKKVGFFSFLLGFAEYSVLRGISN